MTREEFNRVSAGLVGVKGDQLVSMPAALVRRLLKVVDESKLEEPQPETSAE